MEELIQKALELGATHAAMARMEDIEQSEEVRSYCKANACGKYGTNWRCPPGAGSLEELIPVVRSYSRAFVFQTIRSLEDSFDWEGMMAAGEEHRVIIENLAGYLREQPGVKRLLPLGAGACSLCKRCSYLDGKPCVQPDKSLGSIEAYGIKAAPLVESVGMKYINGKDTVSYVGLILFDLSEEETGRA